MQRLSLMGRQLRSNREVQPACCFRSREQLEHQLQTDLGHAGSVNEGLLSASKRTATISGPLRSVDEVALSTPNRHWHVKDGCLGCARIYSQLRLTMPAGLHHSKLRAARSPEGLPDLIKCDEANWRTAPTCTGRLKAVCWRRSAPSIDLDIAKRSVDRLIDQVDLESIEAWWARIR